MKRHCKSFLQSSAQNFEPYKSDNAILRYRNQHSRQLGLDFHLSPIRKIRTITLTNQRDINCHPRIRGNTELFVLIET